MRKITHFNKRFKEDHTGLTGLPLRIFIMVVIAGVCLVVILGYVVVSNPDLDSITIAKIEIDGVYFDRTIFREEMIWIASDYDKNNHSPEEVTSWLKEKDFTHVLVRKEDNKNLDYRGSVNRITYLLSNDRFKAMALNLCHSEKFASEEGNESTYSLYKIKG